MGDTQKDQLYLKDVLRRKSEAGTDDTHYSVLYTEVPDEYKRLAVEELNETNENKEKGLRKLKNFMQKENLSCTDDELVMVLRSCKHNFNKSETRLKKYLKCRRIVVDNLQQLHEDKIKHILDDLLVSVLPYRDASGRAIIVTQPSLNLDVYSMNDIEPVAISLFLYLQSFPLSTICGFSIIMECKCESILIFYPIVKSFRRYIMFFTDLPYRAGRCDILNENFLVRLFYRAVRSIVPDKLYKRVFLNGHTHENLHKVYHPDLLPQEFGGNLPPINDNLYREKLLNFIKQLKAEGQGANGSGEGSNQN